MAEKSSLENSKFSNLRTVREPREEALHLYMAIMCSTFEEELRTFASSKTRVSQARVTYLIVGRHHAIEPPSRIGRLCTLSCRGRACLSHNHSTPSPFSPLFFSVFACFSRDRLSAAAFSYSALRLLGSWGTVVPTAAAAAAAVENLAIVEKKWNQGPEIWT